MKIKLFGKQAEEFKIILRKTPDLPKIVDVKEKYVEGNPVVEVKIKAKKKEKKIF